MSINRLNRSGPLTIKSSTLNTSGSSISSILERIGLSSTSNVSLSSSLSSLNTYSGNSLLDSSNDNKIGIGLVSKGSDSQIKVSNFFGANYLSGSILESSNGIGVWGLEIYPESVVYNSNYLTEQTGSRSYRYTVYSKPTDLSSDFTKDFSYVKSDVSKEYIHSFVDTRIYNVVLKDAISNAYTSSYFTGSCSPTSFNVSGGTLFQALNKTNLNPECITIIRNNVNNSSISSYRKSDLNTILNILGNLISNPKNYTLSGKTRVYTSSTSWPNGGDRSFTFQGLIANLAKGGRYFSGLCTASGGNGGTNYTYSIDECKTTNGNSQLIIYALSTSTGISCNPGTNYVFSNSSVSLSCETDAQPTSTPTSVTDLRLTGSVIFSNSSNNNLNVLITPNNDWIDLNNNSSLLSGQALLRPSFKQTSYTISPGESVQAGFGFGVNLYNSVMQSSSINAKGTFTARFPATGDWISGYTGSIYANMDKHTCLGETPNSGILPN